MRLKLCCVLTLIATLAFAATPEANYKEHCQKCHGADGKAQTRLGKKSGAQNFTDKQAQAKLTDDEAFKSIKNGRKNKNGEERMEGFGGDLSDPEITALVAYIRKFAQ